MALAKATCESSVQAEVDGWLTSIKAKSHGISSKVAEYAFDAYFSGDPPYPSPKLRKDIPDGFIFSQIQEILDDIPAGDELCFISNDKNIRDKAEKKLGIKVFKDLHQFITKGTQATITHDAAKYISVNSAAIKQVIRNQSKFIGDMLFYSLGEVVNEKALHEHKLIKTGGMTVLDEIDQLLSFDANLDELEYYGGSLVVPVDIVFNCNLSAWVDKYLHHHEDHELPEDVEFGDEDEYHYQIYYSESYAMNAIASISFDVTDEMPTKLDEWTIEKKITEAEYHIIQINTLGL
ncbi:hypothetical protein D3C72_701790 [compost metagenome]